MSDLPKSCLRLNLAAFYSTGMDCFGTMMMKIGRHQEKRWGCLFKCMTNRAIHLELKESLDANNFLIAYQRSASQREVPHDLFSNSGTNVKGQTLRVRML